MDSDVLDVLRYLRDMGAEPCFQIFLHKHILISDQTQRPVKNICFMNIKEIINCGHEKFLEAK